MITMLDRIGFALVGIAKEDLTVAENQIFLILETAGVLKLNEYKEIVFNKD